MPGYSQIEIGIHRWHDDSYAVELRFNQPESDVEPEIVRGFTRFDVEYLRTQSPDDPEYGNTLTTSLFATPEIRDVFGKARIAAEALDVPLRIRLFIGSNATELYNLYWETLRDPQQNAASLLTNENILFSRYLSSLDWRPVRRRPQGTLRALVVIANPIDLGTSVYQINERRLWPVKVQEELERAKLGLGSIPITPLASGGTATLDNLIKHLHEGYDIVYFVGHGALNQGDARLYLEDGAGNLAVVTGNDIVAGLGELLPQHRPRLVVLASCESAGDGEGGASTDGGALAALGPRLAEMGIPAVVAMQGNVTMDTIAKFMPVFFRELKRDGQIDRAMAAARGAVRERFDYWVPVLFMRLRSGSLWYVPGFDGKFDKWPALLANIYDGECTPIIGFGLHDEAIGSSRELAQRWADLYHFPMAVHEREDLPQVAQYLAVQLQPQMPLRELVKYLRMELLARFGDKLPPEVRQPGATAEQVIAAVGAYRRKVIPNEPHKVLANLPFPLYITTNPDDTLAEALEEAGKTPRVELCRWNDNVDWPPSVYDTNQDYQPTAHEPLIYHLYGHLKLRDSVVLKEDDYFDYMIGVTANKDLIAGDVAESLTNTALLFLGFRMDEWDFRAFFRSLITSRQGGSRRARYVHVAAQISPEEGRNINPEGARRYLQSYFQEADISIFWGSVEDFMQELQSHWQPYLHSQGGES
jgi:hypothetical protein